MVKEHPAQQGMLLTNKFQKLYKENSQLFYLPHTIISYDIIKLATLIITLTSHLGWEAIILGKPTFLLGKMFYDKYPFINKMSSFEELRRIIRNQEYIYPQRNATVKFIAQLFEISHKGEPFPGNNLYKKNNLENIIFAIEKELGLI